MIKLYKFDENRLLYAETWYNEDTNFSYIHEGSVGHIGENIKTKMKEEVYQETSKKYINDWSKKGYAEFPNEQMHWILVQFDIEPFDLDNNKPLKKDVLLRENVINILNEKFGWMGLGHIDGWDMGIHTNPEKTGMVLNIFCLTVDKELAIQAIKNVFIEKGIQRNDVRIASRINNDGSDFELDYAVDSNITKFFS